MECRMSAFAAIPRTSIPPMTIDGRFSCAAPGVAYPVQVVKSVKMSFFISVGFVQQR